MKKILLGCIALSIAFYACNKSDKNSTPVAKPISPENAQLLSDSLHVLNLQKTSKDSLPAANGSVLLLDNNQDTAYAVSGGYAVIYPNVSEGTPNGYYVKIKGANTLFTINFPVGDPLRQSAKPAKGLLARLQSVPDTAIALRLPLNMLPGIFTVEYEAYDAQQHVSNKIAQVVKVLTNDFSNDDVKALQGNWQAVIAYTLDGTDSTNVTKYGIDSITQFYSCTDNQLVPREVGTPIVSQRDTTSATYNFTSSNRIVFTEQGAGKRLDTQLSHCDSLVYTTYGGKQQMEAAFSYDPANKLITLVVDNNGISSGYVGVLPVGVVSISAHKLDLLMGGTSHVIFTK